MAMISTRFRNLLATLVVLLVMAASSQAAVCELACSVEIEAMSCHAAASSAPTADNYGSDMGMNQADCGHGMDMASAPVSMGACHDGSCSHASLPVLAKAGSAVAVQFAVVHWVAVDVVPVQLRLVGGRAGEWFSPPFLAAGVDPLVVSLRV